jgi:undecaprenyl-diphosphatase
MMEAWQAALLGLVEGITEYLPISSTGHLILASSLLGLDRPEQKAALDAFEIAIQGGAILAVLGLYARRVGQMARGLVGRDPAGLRLLLCIAVAFVPSAVVGLLLRHAIHRYLFQPIPVLAALLAGGIWMIWLDRRHTPDQGAVLESITPRTALAIGLFQCAALWPGTSRSMMTIAGGVLLGLRARDAAEFSFLLGVPTLGAACAWELLQNLLHSARDGTQNLFDMLGVGACAVGFTVAAISAALAVRWLVGFLQRHGLAPFGWYRIALCAVLGALLFAGIVDLS